MIGEGAVLLGRADNSRTSCCYSTKYRCKNVVERSIVHSVSFGHRRCTGGSGGPWPPTFLVLKVGVVTYLIIISY